ncbi:hypothetical protein TIFTF001_010067 [Ficus carica]|uniref:Uncharacterized protein n=1 Tax=Ficus carica TaxID=3494 RepID=A0AA88D455_FICCA|nr:hypothetical protein TIFTF001_010067 [Ficus carica]
MVMDPNDVVQGSFFFSSNQIRKTRELLPKHLRNCTRFELLTSCLWKCRTIALELDPKETARFSCITSIRGKKNVNNLSLPSGYYGNTFAYPAAVSNVRVLHKSPLGYAVEIVKRAKGRVNEEYMKPVADLMVIIGRPLHTVSGNYIVSDTTHVGFDEVDFGWGLPLFGGPAMALSLISMYVPYEDKWEKGAVVLICLPTLVMERFEQELKPYKMHHFKDLKIVSSL